MEQAFVIRSITEKDLDWLCATAPKLGIGFTSLPNDKNFLKKRLQTVAKSFKEEIPVEDRVYLFVRENLPQRELIGICGLDVNIGYKESFYSYQVSRVTQSCEVLDKYIDHTLLHLVNNFQQASEIISFWVDPAHRGHEVGTTLSYSRFLFMAQFKQLVHAQIIAELRGFVDDQQISPFWEAVGRKFFAMDFKVADELTFSSGKQFIADLIPREPIYIDLLPESAQKVIGIEHPAATGARKLLEHQGFKYHDHVDIFDAGPVLYAERDNIHAVANSKLATITRLDHVASTQAALLYNTRLDARFTVAHLDLIANDVVIAPDVAKILDVKVGDQIRYYFM